MNDLDFIIYNKKYIYYLLLKKLDNTENADECYQRLLIRAFENKTRFESKKNYLATEVYNEITRFKKTDEVFKRQIYIEEMERFDVPFVHNLHYEREIINKTNDVLTAIKGLSGLGVAIAKKRLDGYNLDEASESLGVEKMRGRLLFNNAVKAIRQRLGI